MRVRFFRDKPRTVFFLVYSLLFLLAVQAAGFVLPFVFALIVAVVMKPLYDFLLRRFRLRSSFAATAITMLIFLALFAVVGFLLFLVVREALELVNVYWDKIAAYLRSPEMFAGLRDGLLSGDLLSAASEVASALFRTVPLAITFVIITFALTVFFLHHLGDIGDRLLDRAGEYRTVLGRVFSVGYGMVRRFIRSYLLLYLITFVQAVFIFYLTGVEFPLAFAFLTAVADILPVLGPVAVYAPLSISFILQGNYLSGVTMIVWFLITVILRQILEPKLVSRSVKVHPLVALAAIYFSVVSMNVWVLFYVISLFMVFRVLNTAGVFEKGGLPPEDEPH